MSDKCPKCGCEGGYLCGTSYRDKAFKFFCGTETWDGTITQSDKCRIAELEAERLELRELLRGIRIEYDNMVRNLARGPFCHHAVTKTIESIDSALEDKP